MDPHVLLKTNRSARVKCQNHRGNQQKTKTNKQHETHEENQKNKFGDAPGESDDGRSPHHPHPHTLQNVVCLILARFVFICYPEVWFQSPVGLLIRQAKACPLACLVLRNRRSRTRTSHVLLKDKPMFRTCVFCFSANRSFWTHIFV